MTQSREDCRVAAFEREGAALFDGEVDDELEMEPEERVIVVDNEPKSNEVEIGLGCADSTEEGTGIADVSSGTCESNEPLIRSSLH